MKWRRSRRVITPPRRQIDPIECGAICLGIILEYYGRYVDDATLRRQTKVSRNGTDALTLITAAQQFDVHAQAERRLADELDDTIAPAILFFDGCHFVVFEGTRYGRYYLNDPARGRYSVTGEIFRKRYSKLAITITPHKNFKPCSSFNQNADAISLFIPRLLMSILGIMGGLVFIMLSSLVGLFISFESFEKQEWSTSCLSAMTIFLLMLVAIAALMWRTISLTTQSLSLKEHNELKRHVSRISSHFFDDRPFAYFIHTYISVYQRVYDHVQTHVLTYALVCFLAIIVVKISLISLSMSAVLLVGSGFYYLVTSSKKQSLRFAFDQTGGSLHYQETMRAMGQQDLIARGLLDNWITALSCNSDGGLGQVGVNVGRALIGMLVVLVEVFIAAELWRAGVVPSHFVYELIVLVFGFAVVFVHCSFSVRYSDDMSTTLTKNLVSAHRVVPLIEPAQNTTVMLQMNDVNFIHDGEERPLFVGINLAIHHHEIIGVVACDGAGISTLLRLINGYYAPSSGAIIHYSSHNKPWRIALINEDSNLMQGSLKDNLSLFDTRLSDHQLWHALTLACANDVFFNRALGLFSSIDAQGENLSTSEKARILLARALAHQPDIIILDEIFACIDVSITPTILAHLRAQKQTLMFSSFREQELRACDRIVYIDEHARIVSGNHHDLLQNDANYHRLINDNGDRL